MRVMVEMSDHDTFQKYDDEAVDALPNVIQRAIQTVSTSDCSGLFHSY